MQDVNFGTRLSVRLIEGVRFIGGLLRRFRSSVELSSPEVLVVINVLLYLINSVTLPWFPSLVLIPGFLKTGLAKISTHSTTWQFKTIKLAQRPIKSLYLTPGSKLMVPRSIPTSPNLK